MNFTYWITLQKNAIGQKSLLPRLKHRSWKVNSGANGGKVFYLNFDWLLFGFQIDNEW